MTLNSFSFLVFLLSTSILYWMLNSRVRNSFLILAGYYFLYSWSPLSMFLVIFETIINYFLAIQIAKNRNFSKILFVFAIFINLLPLLFLKYSNFFLSFFGHSPSLKILIPLGISFYTLQNIGYLTDIYTRRIKPQKNMARLALFVSFFPQISAGPIAKSVSLIPQIRLKKIFLETNVASGLKLFAYGLFKKLVVADNLGLTVDRIYSSLQEYKGLSLVIVAFLYSWQIYADFSGYTDMARGTARIFGFNLLENFNFPYFSSSLRDFWRRWHISLTSWLREYIYFPLGGNRKGALFTTLNTLVVFLISGFWHGAAWTFVIWGASHGLWLVIERLLSSKLKFSLPHFVKITYSFTVITLFWIMFRAESLNDAFYIYRFIPSGIKNVIHLNYVSASFNQVFMYNYAEMLITFGALTVFILTEFIRSKISLTVIISRQNFFIRYALYVLVAILIIQFRIQDIKKFIYIAF